MHSSDATTCLSCSLSRCFPCLYNQASDNAFFLLSFSSLFCLFIYMPKLLSTLSLCLCLVIQGTSGHSKCADLWGNTDTSLPASMPALQQHQTGTDSSSTHMSLSEGVSVYCLKISKSNILSRIFTNLGLKKRNCSRLISVICQMHSHRLNSSGRTDLCLNSSQEQKPRAMRTHHSGKRRK